MKRLLSLAAAAATALLISSCSVGMPAGHTTPQDGDTVTVNYVGTKDDGSVFDSSKTAGRTPLEFVIGKGGMIKGFEDAVRTMKVGETKKVHIEAKDAYGEEYIQTTVPLDQYKEVITQSVPENALLGNLQQQLPKSQAKQLLGSVAIGTNKKIGEATLKILTVTGDNVTVSIDDPKAPFYGKKIVVGLETPAQDGSLITVKKITADDKTKTTNVDVDIKQNREIVSKTDKEVTYKAKNPHALAGQALNFEIDLLTIKSPTATNGAQTAPTTTTGQ